MNRACPKRNLFKVAKFSLWSFFLLVAISVLPGLGQQVGSDGESSLVIKTEDVKEIFDYQESRLNSLVKASVYISDASLSGGKHYEDIWFHGFGAIGQSRLSSLDVAEGLPVTLQVQPKGFASYAQAQGAAKACLRLYLELYVRGASVSKVLVPDDQFAGSMINELRQAGFYLQTSTTPDELVSAPVVLVLKSEQSGTLFTLIQGYTQ